MAGSVTIRFNSFGRGQGIEDQAGLPPAGVVSVYGNIFGATASRMGCGIGIAYAYNTWTGSGTCAGTGNRNAELPYAVNSVDASADFHLSGSAGGVNILVPAASGCPESDFDDVDRRPLSANCDAGSDER